MLKLQYELCMQLKLQRFSTIQEKQTQMDVEHYLRMIEVPFEREKRLSNHDIPDFFIPSPEGNLILEVKTRFPRKAIFRQLERYAEHDVVHGIILLTGTSMGLPNEMNGKPTMIVSLGEGWL